MYNVSIPSFEHTAAEVPATFPAILATVITLVLALLEYLNNTICMLHMVSIDVAFNAHY